MPVMNFDLEDGLPPVSFSINGEGAERMMNFMSECQQDRDAHAMLTAEVKQLRARIESLAADAERYRFRKRVLSDGGCVMWAAKRCMIYKDGHVLGAGESEDEAIDAAIAKEKA